LINSSYRINVKKGLEVLFQKDPFLLKNNNFYKNINNFSIEKINTKNEIKINWYEASSNIKFFDSFDTIFKDQYLKLIKRKKLEVIKEYQWKLEIISKEQNFKNILVLGPGDGPDLYFIRKYFPNAHITSCDYNSNTLTEFYSLDKLNIKINISDLNDFLKKNNKKFDLIFSQYVLEHSYNINNTINLLYQNLEKGGYIFSCIPLHSFNNNFILKRLKSFTSNSKISRTDMSILDLGHGWKSNLHDIDIYFHQFRNSVFISKKNVVRYQNYNQFNWEKRLSKIEFLNKYIFRPFELLIKLLYSIFKLNIFIRIFYKVDKSIFFSNYHLQSFVPSVLISSKK
jgi:trans-aconitate methyltransferase